MIIQSPAAFAIIFFILGFIAGLIAANLRSEARKASSMPEDLSRPVGEKPQTSSFIPLETSDHLPPPAPPSSPSINKPASISEPPADLQTQWIAALQDDSANMPVKASPVDAFLHSVQKSAIKEPEKPQSMAAQIDAILQDKLPQSPLAGHVIRLLEQPDHTLLVLVDGQKFSGINEVADPAARQLIQDAVAEWQRRSISKSSR